jgi:ABC-type branched-subunit amino acid transport system permease subunit
MQGLHLKIILLHGLMLLLAAYAFVALGYIYDTPLAELYLETDDLSAFEESALRYEVNTDRIGKFKLVQQYTPFAGALFGVVLSFISIRRKKLALQNAVVVFSIALLFALTGLLDNQLIKGILFAPGRMISDSVATAYTLNYLLLLGLSFWLAFSRRLIPEPEGKSKV